MLSAAVLLSAGTIWMTGCKKDDTTPPTITLKGTDPMSLSLQNAAAVTDPGATAEDDKDGDLSSSVTSDWATKVNVNLTGAYTVTYSVSDAAGNTGTLTRTVNVINDAAAYFAGTYPFATCSETDAAGLYVYGSAQTPVNSKPFIVTASTTVNNRLVTNRLGDFDNNKVYFDVVGSTITIPSQTQLNVGIGTASCNIHDRHTDGTGSKITNGFTLTYNDNKVAPCTGTRSGVVANFTK